MQKYLGPFTVQEEIGIVPSKPFRTLVFSVREKRGRMREKVVLMEGSIRIYVDLSGSVTPQTYPPHKTWLPVSSPLDQPMDIFWNCQNETLTPKGKAMVKNPPNNSRICSGPLMFFPKRGFT